MDSFLGLRPTIPRGWTASFLSKSQGTIRSPGGRVFSFHLPPSGAGKAVCISGKMTGEISRQEDGSLLLIFASTGREVSVTPLSGRMKA